MKLPIIEVDGVKYEMRRPKANMWADFAKFDEERKNLPITEYVDKICEFLASQFEGLTKDALLDNLFLEEVQKKYFECAGFLWNLLTGKFEELEKNSENAAATD